jgi:nicotinate phosphoribosyltransferase
MEATTKRHEILLSMLDTDLYKFSVSYAYMMLYPDAEGTFVFQDRGHHKWTDEEFSDLVENMKVIESLDISTDQFGWLLENLSTYISPHYWEWLRSFRYSLKNMDIRLNPERELAISVTDKMHKVTLYEIPILVVVAYTLGKNVNYNILMSIAKLMTKIKIANDNNLVFSEFGTRRRISAEMQDLVIDSLVKHSKTFVGTSNVHFACKYGLKAIGTYPHEWPMFHAAVTGGYIEANNRAMEDWVKVYDGYLGTALIDAFTTPVFLKNFSKKLACLFDGVRQDSGDEYVIGNMIIDRYKQLGIDPKKKFIVFSNGLNFPKFKEIKDYFDGKIGVSAGIGTDSTNDPVVIRQTYKAPSIVMKLMRCRLNAKQDWHNCVKISDDKGKEMGNRNDILMAKYQIGMVTSLDETKINPEWWYQYNKYQVSDPPSGN